MLVHLLEYQEPATQREARNRPRFRFLRDHAFGALLAILLALAVVWIVVPNTWGSTGNAIKWFGWLPLAAVIYLTARLLDWLFERLMENNYKTLLIGRYLRRRRIAWVSLAAVMLCTTMVLVVISVMGGWLDMFEASARGLTGDVVVKGSSLSGFPHYQKMIDAIERDPGVVAAAPTIQTWGLINIDNQRTVAAQVVGLPIDKIGKVNSWPESLYRQHKGLLDQLERTDLTPEQRAEIERRLKEPPRFDLHEYTEVPLNALPEGVAYSEKTHRIGPPDDADLDAIRYDPFGRMLTARGPLSDAVKEKLLAMAEGDKAWTRAVERLARESRWPGMIVGAQLLDIKKGKSGQVQGRAPWKYTLWAKLTVLGIGSDQQFDVSNKAETQYWVVDDSRTGMWQYDSNTVYVPFDRIQSDLGMGARPATDRDGNPVEIPARASEIHIKLKPGQDIFKAKERITKTVEQVWLANRGPDTLGMDEPRVETWKEASALFISAIEKEKLLVVFLFGIISIVAIFLIFCIFYMIVAEKTKDIGIVKSVGATGGGVAGIFLGYGLLIGIVGSGMGFLLSFLIVRNINELHDWLGRALKVQIWNPEVYAFDTIPNKMNPVEVSVILGIALLASVLGALVPAIRAARMHPVEALRWE